MASPTVIEPRKIRDYLLSPSHPRGGAKREFFASLGYTRDGWHVLAADLRRQAEHNDAIEAATTRFGTKYVVQSTIRSPSGTEAEVRSVWIILVDEDFPRFVTAYPRSMS